MPDDRLLHRAAGHSRKVSALTSDEFRVWVQYQLSADDFGVMLFSSRPLRADNDYLDTKSPKLVQRWLERVRAVGLLLTFEHQEQTYCCQWDWQEWQGIEYPRSTLHPKPPAAVLGLCDAPTRLLFSIHPGGKRAPSAKTLKEVAEDLEKDSQALGHLAGARGRETANGQRLTANGSEGGPGETKPPRLAFGGTVLEVPRFLDDEFVKRLNGQFFDLSAFYLALDQRLAQTGEPWDLRWIRDQFAAEAPAPERRRDLRETQERPFTDAERRRAEDHRRRVWGGCRHDPKCENGASCIAQIILAWRAQEVA